MIHVIKRDGSKEELNYEKINQILLWATEGISGVSASDVAMNAKLQLYDNITTEEIHKVLIQSATNLISVKTPNYQYVAANLTNYLLRKQVFGSAINLPSLYEVIKTNVELGVYEKDLLEKYSKEEIQKINSFIVHDRDYDFTYAGIQQLIDKYLVRDRKTGKIYETPQFMYILIPMTLYMNEPNRIKLIKEFYNCASKHRLSLPTPIMAGARTPIKQYSSCVLIDVDDSLDSIFNSNTAIGKYTARRAGIGINAGRIRALGDKIGNGEVVHTGVIPFLRMFQDTTRSCTQNGIRGGNSTIHFPFWHKEIQDIIVLKNNKGTDDNRVRHADYSIQLSKLFYKRVIENKSISLFSPAEVPLLMSTFGVDDEKFTQLYEQYEKDPNISKITISARDLISSIARERIDTGRIYIQNLDHANSHSSFQDKIWMSNLCQEITLPTRPISAVDDKEGEIALCVLAAINLGVVRMSHLEEDLKDVCEQAVRILDGVITHQDYPIEAAKKMLQRRSLGIGVTNFAYFLAKHNLNYDSSKETLETVNKLFEHIQYYCLLASNKLAKEKGACELFNKTKYSLGILPIDTYNKNVDKLVDNKLNLDWESLRKDIKEYGLRNSTLTALMPCESSSLVTNSTNGIEPIRDLIITKKSKQGTVRMVVPEMTKLKNKYGFAFQVTNDSINKITAVMQKWIDQGISVNHYYNPFKFKDGEIPIGEITKDIMSFYQYGGKQLYYANTYDDKKDTFDFDSKKDNLNFTEDNSLVEAGCEGGACSV
jgi:ribonucleoside-diphosphate reductase alpha chain